MGESGNNLRPVARTGILGSAVRKLRLESVKQVRKATASMDPKLGEKIIEILNSSESVLARDRAEYFLYNEMVTATNCWKPASFLGPIDRDVFVVFVNDSPKLGWDHACRYLLFEQTAGGVQQVEERKATQPPLEAIGGFNGTFTPLSIRRPFFSRLNDAILNWFESATASCDVATACEFDTIPNSSLGFVVDPTKAHALLFSGMSEPRHINHLEYTHRVLTKSLGFRAANIRVCNYNGNVAASGTLLPPNNCGTGDYTIQPAGREGSKQRLITEIADLANVPVLTGQDQDVLYLQVDGHGSADAGGSFLRCWDGSAQGTKFYQSDLVNELNRLSRFKLIIVVMHQCSAGGFQICATSPQVNSRVFASSSGPAASDLTSGSTKYTFFTRKWLQGLSSGAATASSWQQLMQNAFNLAQSSGANPVYIEC